MAGESQQQGRPDVTGPTVPEVRKQRDEHRYSAPSSPLLSLQCETLVHRMVSSTFRVGPPPLNLFRNVLSPSTDTRRVK